MHEDIPDRLRGAIAGHGTNSWAAPRPSDAMISDRAWLGLFVATQGVMIALVVLWPRIPWLPFLCDAVMSALTFFLAAERLRSAKPDVRLIWTMLLIAMAYLTIGHLLQFWVLLDTETGVPAALQLAKVSVGGFTWYSAFVTARVPFLFLFAQIE